MVPKPDEILQRVTFFTMCGQVFIPSVLAGKPNLIPDLQFDFARCLVSFKIFFFL